MLQHNNNNNYPCLDVAHRELLHGCRRNGTTFSSALGFSAIPLIKGLRAWAVSGGYSRSRRKAAAASQASEPAHENRIGTSHRKIHSFHAPVVRQGLGALVTVATLKDSDGGRQTQTRCLFLKAEGCNYLCAVGARVDGRKSGIGSQDGVGICDGKPVRKWRKSSRRPKSMENISVVENKEGVVSTKLELLEKCSRTQCLKAKSTLTATNNDEDHLNRSEFSTLHEMCEPATCSPSAKYDSSKEVKEDITLASCSKVNGYEVFVGQDTPISTTDCTDKTTETSKHENDLTADVNHVLKSKEIGMANSEEHSPGSGVAVHHKNESLSTISHIHHNITDSIKYETDILADNKSNELGVDKSKQYGLESEVLSEDTIKTNETLFIVSHRHCEEITITPAFSNHSDDTLTITQVEQQIKKSTDYSSLNPDMEKIVHFGEIKEDVASASNQEVDNVSEQAEEHYESPACSSHKQEIIMEVNMAYEDGKQLNTTNGTFEELADSSSQCSDSFIVANAITSLPNPAPTTNRTALRSISRQQQEETQGRRLALNPALELLEKQERGQEVGKVADEGSKVVDEEDGDEFGVFMKAGDEQVWNEGFNELNKVPCEKHAGIADIRNSSVSNEPPSWMSDWTSDLSIKQSEDTWTAFKQEVNGRGTEKECWFSTAVENVHLTHSSLITVPNVFLEAFPYQKSSCGDSDSIPTLTELLRASAAENRPGKNGRQSLLDSLQDLDRMIGVKYKLAESLSRKLLLQSLNFRTLNHERAGGRKQNMARFSPNLPMSNQQLAANAKRRLSYDINRNIMS